MNKEDKYILETKFYNNPFSFSYSSLNKLLYSPKLFYKDYILNEREELSDAHLVEGKMIHSLLLEDASFDEQFILSPGKIPSHGTGERIVIDKLYLKTKNEDKLSKNLNELEDELLEVMRDVNLHQKLKTDKQRIEKIVTETNDTYFNFLKTKGKKIIIEAEILEKCSNIVSLIKQNELISDLIGLGKNSENYTVYNEIEIEHKQFNLKYPEIGIKGILDNLTVDVQNEIIRINDIKTTSKSLIEFKDSIEYYKYWLQAGFYKKLVAHFLGDDICKHMKLEFRFIAIDKYGSVYPFLVSDTTMAKWEELTDDAIMKGYFHYKQKSFDLPYELAMGQIIL